MAKEKNTGYNPSVGILKVKSINALPTFTHRHLAKHG